MKTIFRTIIAALAATLTLVSCAKDELAGKDSTNPQSEGIRTIAVSFGVPTRSSLVGLQPSFDEDDEILVAQDDGMVEPEVCRVRNVGGKKVISTKLKGKLTLVYPKNAAQMDKSNENIIYGVYVSPSQSGRFEDANICMTKISSTETSAKFENKVAILKFYVDESIGVTKLILSAEDDVYIASGSKSITVQAEDESLLRATGTSAPTLANTTDDSQHRICYVAVNPVTSKQMEVESWTRTQELSESNIVKRKYNDVRLAAGDIANVFVPYYIKVQVSSDPEAYQYWGYCNVGAFLPEEAGYYFSWGNRQGFISKYNVATVLMLAPVGLAVCKKIKSNPVPAIIAIAVSSNLQGAATLVGDTTSILLGGYAKMSFVDFIFWQGKPSIFWAVELGAAGTIFILLFIFRKDKQKITPDSITEVNDYVPAFALVFTVVALIVASFFEIPYIDDIKNGLICLTICVLLIIRTCIKQKGTKPVKAVAEQFDYETVLTLCGLFVGLCKKFFYIFKRVYDSA